MKKILLFPILLIMLLGCQSYPKNFTYYYSDQNTGLDKLIDIDGYYISQHGCDSAFYSMYMFYPNGLFTIATTRKILSELTDCFENGGVSTICHYPLWGTYKVEGNLIKTQVIRTEGHGCVIFRDYRILPNKNIVNVSDYIQSQYTNLGYMSNYPSFVSSECSKEAVFYPLQSKRDSTACPFLKKKWFWEKTKK